MMTQLSSMHRHADSSSNTRRKDLNLRRSSGASTAALPPPPPSAPTTVSEGKHESLTSVLAQWKKSIKGQWTSAHKEWALERERLALAREEWESKVESVESSLGLTSAKVDAGLTSLALMQSRQWIANGDVICTMGFPGLVTPPSPRSLSTDSNCPCRQRKKESREQSQS